MAQTEMQEVLPQHQETLFHCGVTEHWHRLPRSGVSILGDIQKLPGHGPEQLVLNDSA